MKPTPLSLISSATRPAVHSRRRLAAEARLWLVEWPERGVGALPAADLEVRLAVEGEGQTPPLLAGAERAVDPAPATAEKRKRKTAG